MWILTSLQWWSWKSGWPRVDNVPGRKSNKHQIVMSMAVWHSSTHGWALHCFSTIIRAHFRNRKQINLPARSVRLRLKCGIPWTVFRTRRSQWCLCWTEPRRRELTWSVGSSAAVKNNKAEFWVTALHKKAMQAEFLNCKYQEGMEEKILCVSISSQTSEVQPRTIIPIIN